MPTAGKKKTSRILKTAVKVVLWTLMSILLAVYGVSVCLVKVLSPEDLTPIVERVANKVLDAHVEIGRVSITANEPLSGIMLAIDSLTVTNPGIAVMKADSALALPEYADSLLSAARIEGELSIAALVRGKIDINNFDISGLAANVVVINDSVNNYNIIKPSGDADTSQVTIPAIILRHFSVKSARELRFYDAVTGTSAALSLVATVRDKGKPTAYTLSFDGDFRGDMLQPYHISEVNMVIGGDLYWDYADPYRLKFEKLSVAMPWLTIAGDIEVSMDDSLTVDGMSFDADMTDINRMLGLVPDEYVRLYGLDKLHCDGNISVSVRLDSAFTLGTDSIPYATVKLEVPDCALRYGKARLENFDLDAELLTRGNNLSDAVVFIHRLHAAGPATVLDISATLGDMAGDIAFAVDAKGYTNLAKLPPLITRHLNGYLEGRVKVDFTAEGRQSMFSRNEFHKLKAAGDVSCRNFYWLSSDTSNMVVADLASLKLGTNFRHGDSKNVLAASLTADTVDILSGGVSVAMKELSLGIGAANQRPTLDSTIVIPMGGMLKVKSVGVQSITDSAGVKLRDIAGKVTMRRFKQQERVPEFVFDLGIGRMSAGTPDVRMLLSDSRLHVDAHKLPERKYAAAVRRTADSIAAARPDLSPDSVYALAVEKRRRHHSPHKRVHAEMTDSSTEIIDWGTSKLLGTLLLDWRLNGELNSKRAALYTRHFPLRNRLRDLDITFDNDTVLIKRMSYKVGRSDFMAAGRITNVKRGLTARRLLSPVKMELEAESDTVDVNQLAEAFFKGAAFSEHRRQNMFDDADNDSVLEAELDKLHFSSNDSAAPLLVPANIQAEIKLKAQNILYSDLTLNDLTGDVLMYDGAVSLHRLKASSDVGSVDVSALYSAPKADDMHFGFGMEVKSFDISKFMGLVPALDSIMPLLRDISGIINADLAATVDIGRDMNIELPTLAAAIKLEGDSLKLMDAETFRTIAKWLMFKDKNRNLINRMEVEMVIDDGQMKLFPFVFDIDRYKIGVQGYNDLALNFNYQVSVLKSPLPFKFGITLKGNPEHYKIRLGRAKFDEKQALSRDLLADSTRVNLLDELENVFKRGVRRSRFASLSLPRTDRAASINFDEQPVTAADSLVFIREGLIPAPDPEPALPATDLKKKKTKEKK